MSKSTKDISFSITHVNLIFGCLEFQTLAEEKCYRRDVYKNSEHIQLDIL